MTMEMNEFVLANQTLENEVKLSCSVEETPTGKKIRMEFRNLTYGPMSPRIQLLDGHLNYTLNDAKEATRLVAYLKGLIKQL
jgi:hypothetical protein